MAKSPNHFSGKKLVNRAIGRNTIWQRGISGNIDAVTSLMLQDRILLERSSTNTYRANYFQASGIGKHFAYTPRFETTTAQTLTASSWAHIAHIFEGQNVVDLIGKIAMVSFYAKSDQVGYHTFALRNGTTTESYVSKFLIGTADTWSRITVPVPIPLALTGVDQFENKGLIFTVATCRATDLSLPDTSLNQWVSGNFTCADTSLYVGQNVGSYIDISGLMLYDASFGELEYFTAGGDFDSDLHLCQRYFWPAQGRGLMNGFFQTTTEIYSSLSFPTTMRVPPNFSFVGNYADFIYSRAGTSSAVASSVVASSITTENCIVDTIGVSPSTAGYGTVMGPTNGSYFALNAEF